MIPPVQRRARLAGGLALLALFGVSWLAYPLVTNPRWPVFCVFRIVTKKPCFLCGMTRAFASAARGHWADATGYHPLWWILAGAAVVMAVLLFTDAAAGSNTWATGRRFGRLLLWPVAALWMIVCVARLFW